MAARKLQSALPLPSIEAHGHGSGIELAARDEDLLGSSGLPSAVKAGAKRACFDVAPSLPPFRRNNTVLEWEI
jgi:hypothetical protein